MTLSEAWKRTVEDGVTNKAWDAYDQTIKAEVSAYNTRFAKTPNYKAVEWKLMKAMTWVESGAQSSDWKTFPMQIGKLPKDAGYSVIKGLKDGADVIMSDALKKDIKDGSINEPKLNVRAGIAYVFVRMAETKFDSIYDETDKTTHEYTVLEGDSLDKIAKKVGSTLDVLRRLNPSVTILRSKQKIFYRKASFRRVIKDWKTFDTKTVARQYNGKGDPDYAAKLDYVLELFKKIKR